MVKATGCKSVTRQVRRLCAEQRTRFRNPRVTPSRDWTSVLAGNTLLLGHLTGSQFLLKVCRCVL